ncbi:DUF3667 domain-containing protein [Pseudidiomarina insulisalsae]|uniref:DUF3667 domain-containing protein n=1 Tax=Pseudidiomarina insulisalsae TaxID=575789 RepID=A0A432YQD1_9GAMM|nr:DUF3667 domain-containing protein [Pseudidiomarina insulisalsae]RUO63558.1 hypothetical protein CWI71_00400 [Pseudidiomarina insulisalsae]
MTQATQQAISAAPPLQEPRQNDSQHRCKNCDSELIGEFCHVCGQQDRQYIRSIFAVVGDLMGEISHWDSRFYRTLVALFMRPAFLTQEFVRGRHASYVPPLRLYFFISLVSFLVLTTLIDFDNVGTLNSELTPEQRAEAEAGLKAAEEATNQTLELPALPAVDASEVAAAPLGNLKVSLPFATPEQEQQIEQRIQELAQEPKVLIKRLVSLAPQMMLLMLPFWALFLKLIYLFSKRFYLEHLSAALHTHAFLLLSLMILTVLSKGSHWASEWTGSALIEDTVDWAENILLVWMVSYMLFTQKLFYGQGWAMTLFKFALSGLAYIVLLSFAFVIMLFIGILTA